jgi:tRNA(Arg) A34 adenosine deaminase TadA
MNLKYFNLAKQNARLSTFSNKRRLQIGAIIVFKNKVIASGFNTNKTNPLQRTFAFLTNNHEAIYSHAEINVIYKVIREKYNKKDFEEMDIYIYREVDSGLGLSKPCNICEACIKTFIFRNVYYTSENGYVCENFN